MRYENIDFVVVAFMIQQFNTANGLIKCYARLELAGLCLSTPIQSNCVARPPRLFKHALPIVPFDVVSLAGQRLLIIVNNKWHFFVFSFSRIHILSLYSSSNPTSDEYLHSTWGLFIRFELIMPSKALTFVHRFIHSFIHSQ